MEIERKFTVRKLPDNLSDYPCRFIEQAYLNTDPVLRVRRQDDKYILTYKGSGLLAHEEYNLDLNKKSYEHLLTKADGNIITKKRYLIPILEPVFAEGFVADSDPKLCIELDIFEGCFDGLIIAEVEFPSIEMANAFQMVDWFLEDVTSNREYHNSNLSRKVF